MVKKNPKKSVFKVKKAVAVKTEAKKVPSKTVEKKGKVEAPAWTKTFPIPDLRLRKEVAAKLEEALRQVPKEQVAKVKKQLGGFLEGDLPWLRLFTLPPEQLHELAKIGYSHFESSRYETARKIFEGLAILDPENYYYHSMLAVIAQREEKWAEAILEYSIALDRNPADRSSYTNRGEVYFKLGFLREARNDFELAVGGDDGKDPWANRARLLMQQMETIQRNK
ncbi:MAG: tetratricopeptide repeat protein [bacterium]|nr:tetratricopeptide repeat protein [bacterium]